VRLSSMKAVFVAQASVQFPQANGAWLFLVVCLFVTVSGSWAGEVYRFKMPRYSAYETQTPQAVAPSTLPEDLDWISAHSLGPGGRKVSFGRRLVLGIPPAAEVEPLLRQEELQLIQEVDPGLYLVQASSAGHAIRVANALSLRADVQICYPVMRTSVSLEGAYAPAPNDPHFGPNYGNVVGQWYLENRDPATGESRGVDLNVRAAWPKSVGSGILVAVADIGVELDHQDLAIPREGLPHFDFVLSLTNGAPSGSSGTYAHGTSVASLIAAKGQNQFGMIGVAPEASVASWVILENANQLVSDDRLMEMYQYASQSVHIQNHSWGHEGPEQQGPTPLEQVGIAKAIEKGRNGKGVIMVRSAGNERASGARADDEGYAADPRVITVAAATMTGISTSYSEPGACVLVGAPAQDSKGSGLFAADLSGTAGVNVFGFLPPFQYLSDFVFHSNGFGGTSAAAPLVSGVAALVLSVRPDLGYRDVQQILLLCARHHFLDDWDLARNGAGVLVNHSLGFGIPDAGYAVSLARRWVLRPALEEISITNGQAVPIPDGGLRLLVRGEQVPDALRVLHGLPSVGIHPDEPLGFLPLLDLGLATNVPSVDLHGKAALIQRGTNAYAEKLSNAAAAGARFAVIWNFATNQVSGCPGGDQLCIPGGTSLSPIPALFISHADGLALQQAVVSQSDLEVQLGLTSAQYSFTVTNSLLCEQVGVRIQTDHSLRGDLRVTLISPQGTRSILQEYNADQQPGPLDWTYWSTHHFFESSAGVWRVEITDELLGSTGNVLSAGLLLRGVGIEDSDADGLDDRWEWKYFGSLAKRSDDDPDGDGDSNMLEQLLGANPAVSDRVYELSLCAWNSQVARLSWPGVPGESNTIWASQRLAPWTQSATVPGAYPETEWFTSMTNQTLQFYRIESHRDEAPH
jgi:subtilisin family serine protease/subtilisin-like proprotein convertase family protein